MRLSGSLILAAVLATGGCKMGMRQSTTMLTGCGDAAGCASACSETAAGANCRTAGRETVNGCATTCATTCKTVCVPATVKPSVHQPVHKVEEVQPQPLPEPVKEPVQNTSAEDVSEPRSSTPEYEPVSFTPHPTAYAHADDYRWLVGTLQRVHTPQPGWKVRYAALDKNDVWGGSMVLAQDARLDSFRDGDVVYVEGEILADRPSVYLTGPLYRIHLMRIATAEDRMLPAKK